MARPDDSRLDPGQELAVQAAARRALDRAAAWGVLPTPITAILDAAKLRVAPVSVFDPRRIMDYLISQGERAVTTLQSALDKIWGIFDADDNLIHVDPKVRESKQNFLKLHEAGHHELPTHRKVFRIFRDCEKTLDPETADLFLSARRTISRASRSSRTTPSAPAPRIIRSVSKHR